MIKEIREKGRKIIINNKKTINKTLTIKLIIQDKFSNLNILIIIKDKTIITITDLLIITKTITDTTIINIEEITTIIIIITIITENIKIKIIKMKMMNIKIIKTKNIKMNVMII